MTRTWLQPFSSPVFLHRSILISLAPPPPTPIRPLPPPPTPHIPPHFPLHLSPLPESTERSVVSRGKVLICLTSTCANVQSPNESASLNPTPHPPPPLHKRTSFFLILPPPPPPFHRLYRYPLAGKHMSTRDAIAESPVGKGLYSLLVKHTPQLQQARGRGGN